MKWAKAPKARRPKKSFRTFNSGKTGIGGDGMRYFGMVLALGIRESGFLEPLYTSFLGSTTPS